MYTIGDLCKKFKLSRSTILYYDRLNLLKPESRGNNNYRIYDEAQLERLEEIIKLKSSGVSLKEILNILDAPKTALSEILVNRLDEIQAEISSLKEQEKGIVNMLKEETLHNEDIIFTPEEWTNLLVKLGYDHKKTLAWHRAFEEENSKMHREFLIKLGMDEKRIQELMKRI